MLNGLGSGNRIRIWGRRGKTTYDRITDARSQCEVDVNVVNNSKKRCFGGLQTKSGWVKEILSGKCLDGSKII